MKKTIIFLVSLLIISPIGISGALAKPIYKPQVKFRNINKTGLPNLMFGVSQKMPVSDIVLAGTTKEALSTITFKADGDNYLVQELSFSISDSIFASSLGLLYLEYPTQYGTGMAQGYLAGQEVVFTGLDFYIVKNRRADLYFFADVNTINSGSSSGAHGSVNINAHGVFKATAIQSGITDTNPTDNLGSVRYQDDVWGNEMVVRKTKPAITLSPLPSNDLHNGELVVSKFAISTDARGDVALRKISWEFHSRGDLVVANPRLYDISNPSLPLTLDYFIINDDEVSVGLINEEVISAGSSKTYFLKVTVTNVATQGDKLIFRLPPPASEIITDRAYVVEQNAGFVWSDMSAIPHNFNSLDWTNGRYVSGLPSAYQRLAK